MKGLKIKEKWADLILEGDKIWELRGSTCKNRGTIGIVKCGTSKVFGEANFVEVIPLTKEIFEQNFDKHKINLTWEQLRAIYKKPYAWVFVDVHKYEEPRAFENLQGSVKWVNIKFK